MWLLVTIGMATAPPLPVSAPPLCQRGTCTTTVGGTSDHGQVGWSLLLNAPQSPAWRSVLIRVTADWATALAHEGITLGGPSQTLPARTVDLTVDLQTVHQTGAMFVDLAPPAAWDTPQTPRAFLNTPMLASLTIGARLPRQAHAVASAWTVWFGAQTPSGHTEATILAGFNTPTRYSGLLVYNAADHLVWFRRRTTPMAAWTQGGLCAVAHVVKARTMCARS